MQERVAYDESCVFLYRYEQMRTNGIIRKYVVATEGQMGCLALDNGIEHVGNVTRVLEELIGGESRAYSNET